ncbi:MAG TPA: M20/M25/M40 family metallo-hydrolase [Actinobacteria bacterium]|nr:M20/M25/M40 family metallo-hydrolase [Actinomycetota bacterium]
MGEAVELLVELIRNGCVNDGSPASGNERRSVETLREFFGEAGTVVEPLPGRASVVYRLEGTDPRARTLAFLPHLDVVPADPAGWTHPPFSGVRVDGWVWGRGAVDMLNLTAAMAVVYRAVRDGDLPLPPGGLVFAAVADEEAGGVYGAAHLVDEHWPLVRCDDLLTEVAAPALRGPGGVVIPVTAAEKGPAWTRLCTHGRPGHASQPHGTENAIVPLAAAVARLGTAEDPVSITDEWRRFLASAPFDPELTARLADPDLLDAAIADLAEADPAFARWVHACTHLTVAPTVITGGVKANVVPDRAQADVDVRMLPGHERADVDDHFRKVLGPGLADEVELEAVLDFPATGSEPSGPLWEAIGDAAERHLGARRVAPTLSPVATDARFFRARGVQAFGVGCFDDETGFGEMLSMFHGIDERVSERSVDLTVEFLGDVVTAYAARTGR